MHGDSNGNGFDFTEFTELIKQIETLGADNDIVAEAVLDAGSEPARKAFEENVPRSTLNKKHAQDHVQVSRTLTARRTKNKYRLIEAVGSKKDFTRRKRSGGSTIEKGANEFSYLYMVEYGHSNAPPHPFLEQAYRDAQASATPEMRQELIRQIEKHLE